jgi:demethylmenaquinone methyltransferase / 2-methoxy-6-polyprenyl-1,4-benzoquinol methylase
MGAVLSFGQDPLWRRFLISRVGPAPGRWALDVASGTGLVARALSRRTRTRVVALDQSEAMLRAGVRRRASARGGKITPVLAEAECLPFPDAVFEAVTFTYLLRYVDDPAATLAELARVLRPGGTLCGLEFHVPEAAVARLAWNAYTRGVMPLLGAAVSPAWRHTGAFLGPSVSAFYRRYPLPVQIGMWQQAGVRHVRTRLMSFGSAIVIWGERAPSGDD